MIADGWKELVRFEIPFLPPSVNQLYGISTRNKKVSVFMRSEWRTFKEKAKMFMPPRTIKEDALVRLDIDIYANWYFQNGGVRKLDIQNMEKALIDAISEKYYFGDERVFYKTTQKMDGQDKIKVALFIAKEKETVE